GGAAAWTAKAPGAAQLGWLAADANTIYFAGYSKGEGGSDYRGDSPLRVGPRGVTPGKRFGDLAIKRTGKGKGATGGGGVRDGRKGGGAHRCRRQGSVPAGIRPGCFIPGLVLPERRDEATMV